MLQQKYLTSKKGLSKISSKDIKNRIVLEAAAPVRNPSKNCPHLRAKKVSRYHFKKSFVKKVQYTNISIFPSKKLRKKKFISKNTPGQVPGKMQKV